MRHEIPGQDPAWEESYRLEQAEERRHAMIEAKANDMVCDAQQRCATPTLALRYLANEYEDSEARTRAFELLLDDVQAARRVAA